MKNKIILVILIFSLNSCFFDHPFKKTCKNEKWSIINDWHKAYCVDEKNKEIFPLYWLWYDYPDFNIEWYSWSDFYNSKMYYKYKESQEKIRIKEEINQQKEKDEEMKKLFDKREKYE